jgi:hypothetical protein
LFDDSAVSGFFVKWSHMYRNRSQSNAEKNDLDLPFFPYLLLSSLIIFFRNLLFRNNIYLLKEDQNRL